MPWSKDSLPENVKSIATKEQWSDSQISAFVKTANAILEKEGDEAIAIATGMKQAREKTNAKRLPEIFYCRHMQPGLCGYDNETILFDTEDLKKLIPSFAGKPVYVYHQTVDLENLQEEADGYVTDCFYNETDGWLWAKFLAVSDEAHSVIARGWSVSNAYVPTEWGDGGQHHNVDYDRRLVNGKFTHLALVPNPRYENARIYTPEEFKQYQEQQKQDLQVLQNSKPNGVKKMFKMFKTERKEVTEFDENTEIELQNGKTATVKEMVDAVLALEKRNAEDAEKKKVDEKMNDDTPVKVGDDEMPLRELVNKYNAMKKNADEDSKKEKENADAESAKEAKEAKETAEAKENAEKEEAEEEKKNGKFFDEMRNAGKTYKGEPVIIETTRDALARGKERY